MRKYADEIEHISLEQSIQQPSKRYYKGFNNDMSWALNAPRVTPEFVATARRSFRSDIDVKGESLKHL